MPSGPNTYSESAERINVRGSVVGDIDLPAETAGKTINVTGSLVGNIKFGPASRGNVVIVSGCLIGDIRLGPTNCDNLIEVCGSMVGDIKEGINNHGNVVRVSGSLVGDARTTRQSGHPSGDDLATHRGLKTRIVNETANGVYVVNIFGTAASAFANATGNPMPRAAGNTHTSAGGSAEASGPPRNSFEAWQQAMQSVPHNSLEAWREAAHSRVSARDMEGFQLSEIAAMVQGAGTDSTKPSPIKRGDTGVVIVDGTELYLNQQVVAELPEGTEIHVLEVRDGWIGAAASVDGEAKIGWIDGRKVSRQVSPAEPHGRFHEQDQRNRELEDHQMPAKPWKVSGN